MSDTVNVTRRPLSAYIHMRNECVICFLLSSVHSGGQMKFTIVEQL